MTDKIPGLQDWLGYKDDIDSRFAFEIFFDKTRAELQPLFKRNVIERTDELRFMPVRAFQYYIFALRDYIVDEHYSSGDSDCAVDCYFSLVQEKLDVAPDAILPVMELLLPSLHFIASNVAAYKINEDIYGSISQRLQTLLQRYRQLRC
ncbi:hypothetical protein Rhein_2927 [Rheinheimera sp. A13L]|uniref:hypothetical protein n=1 Tax=Rheinheimera sp. A13L TaxID=506534 RepID=UPI0002125040|nr:hypothetical protein [Rheinheimera sp. A13L]EGM76987.1 hypothetical protein Rhein_2927 [Rheinheimera sp. A13L]